jgi:hypothetical protein
MWPAASMLESPLESPGGSSLETLPEIPPQPDLPDPPAGGVPAGDVAAGKEVGAGITVAGGLYRPGFALGPFAGAGGKLDAPYRQGRQRTRSDQPVHPAWTMFPEDPTSSEVHHPTTPARSRPIWGLVFPRPYFPVGHSFASQGVTV